MFVFSQIKDINQIEQNIHSVAWVMLQEWDLKNEKTIQAREFYFSQGNLEKNVMDVGF